MNEEQFSKYEKKEAEADSYGAFIAHLAGYSSTEIIPTLIERLYLNYHINDGKIKGYPTLTDRKRIALNICEEIQQLVQIYQTGHHLFAIGAYNYSAACYHYALNFVRCKEIYNNLGMALLAQATQQKTGNSMNLHYPFVVDTDEPFREADDTEQKKLINLGIEYLTKAVNYDNTYFDGFLNLACAYELLGDINATNELIATLERITKDTRQLAELTLLKGILAAHQNQTAKATRLFQSVQQLTTDISTVNKARLNLHLLENGQPATLLSSNSFSIKERNRIDNMELAFPSVLPTDKTIALPSPVNASYQLKWQQTPNAVLSLFQTDETFDFAIVWTSEKKVLTLSHLGIGNNALDIQKSYQHPDAIFRHTNGFFWVYDDLKLVFDFDMKEKCRGWGVFGVY